MKIRTRFAPSPTGYLHIGGARTALFAWLYAKQQQGEFILRIEDTDVERSTQTSIDAILESMAWLGLDYTEPLYYQSQRFERYKEVIDQLLESGHAYRCYCSKERLEKLRAEQINGNKKPRYDNFCRDRQSDPSVKEQPFVVRFRNPVAGVVSFDDLVHGNITIANNELDDLIIARSDGMPTYNLTVVVDDMDMAITHVIRGDDHINNTPRQINILHALNANIPKYAHVPMILGPDGKRLSKRHGAVSVLQYRDDGYLPEALLNYLVRLGWSHGDDEIFSREEMINLFSLNAINKAPATFNPQKLLWLNHHYIKSLPVSVVANVFDLYLKNKHLEVEKKLDLETLIIAQRERCQTLGEMDKKSHYFFFEVGEYEPKAAKKFLTPTIKPILKNLKSQFSALEVWEKIALHDVIVEVASEFSLSLGKVAQPVRVAVTGGTVSPSIDITLELIGRDDTFKRIEKAIIWINKLGEENADE